MATEFFDDWCPNRTRIVTCEEQYVTAEVLLAVAALLRRKYERWRIEIVLVRSLENDDVTGMITFNRRLAICYRSGTKLVRAARKLQGIRDD